MCKIAMLVICSTDDFVEQIRQPVLTRGTTKKWGKKWPIGTEILRDGMKLASVSGVKTYWRVVYEDNDYEELNANEMKKARI